jgi:hypothetical protein
MNRPGREVKCSVCPWNAVRKYGARGILVEPCPLCGRRVCYAAAFKGDQPVTGDVRASGCELKERVAA